MPVVTFDRPDLCRLIGRDVPMDRLTERMPMIGGDLDKVEGEAITIEWFPDRPDLLTPEGTARALRAFLDVSPGLPSYAVVKPRTELHVDASVASVRPFAALCFVRGVPVDDAYLDVLIAAQEKLTLAPGRKRRKIAIGMHDAKGLQGPFRYTCIGPEEKPFVPLGWTREATPREILSLHGKGQEYGHLIPMPAAAEAQRIPVFLDGAGRVISLPPVINAQATAMTAATRDILLDVTGTDAASVRRTIALLATGLADRGGSIEPVTVHDASGTWASPDLRPTERVLDTDAAAAWLGIQLGGDQVAACLRRMGHGAEAFDNRVLVQVPAWRFDILHDVDLLEDVAIGYGFENFQGRLPTRITPGGALATQAGEDKLRLLLLGHGFAEARTLTLSNAADQWGHWGEQPGAAVRVKNAALEEQDLLRVRLVPSLLRTLAANRHRSLPQRLFEVGYVVTDGHNRLHMACAETHARAGFSEAKALATALLADLGIDGELRPAERPGFIPGRQGNIVVDAVVIGHFGEVHPDVLVAFGLGAATTTVELDVAALQA